jgi:hypothetical protein
MQQMDLLFQRNSTISESLLIITLMRDSFKEFFMTL